MRVLTQENASETVGGKPLDAFLSELSGRLGLVGDTYSIPPDSGRKTALSRLLAYLLLRGPSACIYISGWGVWESSENLDLFYGYRRSFGENRTLVEAPVHVFQHGEESAFASILSMALYFVWDAWVFDTEGNALVRISHDEWLEVRTNDANARNEFAAELKDCGMPLLER